LNDSVLDIRRSGVLLHLSSLPGSWPSGHLGPEARRFVDFLVVGGQSIWQMLPLGVPHEDGSPYQCLSLFAGNPLFISPEELLDSGWLEEGHYQDFLQRRDDYESPLALQAAILNAAQRGFHINASAADQIDYDAFLAAQSYWLADYALYQALRQYHNHNPWWLWPSQLRNREHSALASARKQFSEQIAAINFEQYIFFKQWQVLKAYANEHGVLMFGDMPIFIAHDSVDVWCEPELFDIDEQGQPRTVTGVPPDYFSETGQRWGNPHYCWDKMAADDFCWWRKRFALQLQMFDIIRVDHFRGFEASWEIPAEHELAIDGTWIQVPGKALFHSLLREFGTLPLVAEDLGIITPEVEELRDMFHFPGMKILQFAFGGDHTNPYLPEHHVQNCVVYTGTHDNDTTLGWFQTLDEHTRQQVQEYLTLQSDHDMPWALIELAESSVANTVVIPMQDLMGLDGSHRMNVPGTTSGNWRWRFAWADIPAGLTERLQQLTEKCQRLT
jgi:4-alpha-glucanotransferase